MKFKVTTDNFLDIEFFQTLQDRFAEEFGIASIITDVNGVPLTKPSNFTEFCIKHVRACEEGLKKCQFFDAYGGCKAKINKEPIIYPCHAGLTDFASPIILGETQVGCFLCGQVLTEKPDEEKFRNYAKELKIDEDKYIEALRKVKILPYERIEYIADFLYKISSKMSTFIFYQNMGISANKFYKNTIDEFHKQLESDKDNKLESEKNSLKNILDKILETLKGNYEVNEKELEDILLQLVIEKGLDYKKEVESLNTRLENNNLIKISNKTLEDKYIDLAKNWLHNDILELNKEYIMERCKEANLYISNTNKNLSELAIISFTDCAGHLKNENIKRIDFSSFFESGKWIKNPASWKKISEEIQEFIKQEKPNTKYGVHLECSYSVAFLAGCKFNSKSGIIVYPYQKKQNGIDLWNDTENSDLEKYDDIIDEEIEKTEDENFDSVVIIGMTFDIKTQVLE